MKDSDSTQIDGQVSSDAESSFAEQAGVILSVALGFASLDHPTVIPIFIVAVFLTVVAGIVRVQRTGVLTWPWKRRVRRGDRKPSTRWTALGLVAAVLAVPVVLTFAMTDRLSTAAPAAALALAGLLLLRGSVAGMSVSAGR